MAPKPIVIEKYKNYGSKVAGHVLVVACSEFQKIPGVEQPEVLEGYEVDCRRIELFFRSKKYRVIVKKNLPLKETKAAIKEFAEQKIHSPIDSCFVFILSHGDETDDACFMCYDQKFLKLEWVLKKFGTQKAPYLVDVPKFLIAQACRGSDLEMYFNMDKWVSKQLKAQAREKAASCISDSDSETKVPEDEEVMARSREKQITSKEVPDRCDMCLVQSTRKGTVCFVHPIVGSRLICGMIETFEEHSATQPVITILHETCKKVRSKIKWSDDRPDMTKWRGQTPQISQWGMHNKDFFIDGPVQSDGSEEEDENDASDENESEEEAEENDATGVKVPDAEQDRESSKTVEIKTEDADGSNVVIDGALEETVGDNDDDSDIEEEVEHIENPIVRLKKPVCLIVLGMTGSGKTTFVDTLISRPDFKKTRPCVINLDPSCREVPFSVDIDIRDRVNYKEVMKQYSLGPNGGIVTSLNLFASEFGQVIKSIEERASTGTEFAIFDTPGQIEVFAESASGSIISDSLAALFPTVIVYVIDTVRSVNPVTFMSYMLNACSILHKLRLPFIIVMNKNDVTKHEFAMKWMQDFKSFNTALNADSTYNSNLSRSLSLTLDEFYENLEVVGVSSATGGGMDEFLVAVQAAALQYDKNYCPDRDRLKKLQADLEMEITSQQLSKTAAVDETDSNDAEESSSDEEGDQGNRINLD